MLRCHKWYNYWNVTNDKTTMTHDIWQFIHNGSFWLSLNVSQSSKQKRLATKILQNVIRILSNQFPYFCVCSPKPIPWNIAFGGDIVVKWNENIYVNTRNGRLIPTIVRHNSVYFVCIGDKVNKQEDIMYDIHISHQTTLWTAHVRDNYCTHKFTCSWDPSETPSYWRFIRLLAMNNALNGITHGENSYIIQVTGTLSKPFRNDIGTTSNQCHYG